MLDTDELRIRVACVRLGAVSTFALVLAGLAYYAATWQAPHRPVMTGLAAAFGVLAVALAVLPVDRLVVGRTRDVFFVCWSIVSTGGVAFFYHLDGGGRSPIAFGLVLALAFAALLYPLRGAIGVAALVIVTYLSVALAHPHAATDVLFVAASLLLTSVMCVGTAFWRDRQRLELTRLSRTDPLTGCLNRRGLEERVERAVAGGGRFALVTLDLDDFKGVNDRHGHAAGDAVLRAAVRCLQEAVRPADAVGRLGGDEFAILLPGASREVAGRVVDRAVLALSVTAPASFGVAGFPEDGRTSDALFRRADAAVYGAKAQRRGRGYGAGLAQGEAARRAAASTAARISAAPAGLATKRSAPSASARAPCVAASRPETTTTAADGAAARIRGRAVSPSAFGIERSSRTTSGRAAATTPTTASPSSASPTTSTRPSCSSVVRMSARMPGASSHTTTRIGPADAGPASGPGPPPRRRASRSAAPASRSTPSAEPPRSAAAMPTEARTRELAPVEGHGGGQRRERAVGHGGGIRAGRHPVAEERERVGAEAGDRVGRAHDRAQPRGHLDQHGVRRAARRSSPTSSRASLRARALEPGERLGRAVREQRAAGQPGEPVVQGGAGERQLRVPALDRVAQHARDELPAGARVQLVLRAVRQAGAVAVPAHHERHARREAVQGPCVRRAGEHAVGRLQREPPRARRRGRRGR